MDEADWAKQISDESTLAAVKNALRNGAARAPARSDCLQCGEPIPAARIAAVPGVQRCVDCQSVRERKAGG